MSTIRVCKGTLHAVFKLTCRKILVSRQCLELSCRSDLRATLAKLHLQFAPNLNKNECLPRPGGRRFLVAPTVECDSLGLVAMMLPALTTCHDQICATS